MASGCLIRVKIRQKTLCDFFCFFYVPSSPTRQLHVIPFTAWNLQEHKSSPSGFFFTPPEGAQWRGQNASSAAGGQRRLGPRVPGAVLGVPPEQSARPGGGAAWGDGTGCAQLHLQGGPR